MSKFAVGHACLVFCLNDTVERAVLVGSNAAEASEAAVAAQHSRAPPSVSVQL